MTYFNEESNCRNNIVNLFKSYCSSVNEVNSNNLPINNISLIILNSNTKINSSKNDIFNGLWFIKSNTSLDKDDIFPIFLKECAFIITSMLNFLFNQSLHTDVFSDKWKTLFTSPIYKNKNLVQNYHPSSKISCCYVILNYMCL